MSCYQSDYTKLVKSELAKGIRKDSILLGMHFGDTRNEFYGKCFDLNKQRVLMQGDGGSVQYLFTDSIGSATPAEVKLLFVPSFDNDDKLTNMDFRFSATAWAPWNQSLQSDSVEYRIEKILMHWYGGNAFIKAKVEGKQVPVKLDGNRRIMIFLYDTREVVVRVQDILHPKFRHSITKEGVEKEAVNVE